MTVVTEVVPRQPPLEARRGRPLRRVLVGLLVLAVFFTALSVLLQHAYGRTSTIERVGETGVRVAHPDVFAGASSLYGHRPTGLHLSCGESRHYTHHSGDLSREFAFTLRSTFTGRLEVDGDLDTRLDHVIYRGQGGHRLAERYVAALPAPTSTDAVLVLSRPTHTSELESEPLRRNVVASYHSSSLIYVDPQANPEELEQQLGHWVDAPVSWPTHSESTLASWTAQLGHGDDVSLRELGLPDSAALKRIAKDDLVYGLYASRLSPDDLRDVLADPRFETLIPVETRFDENALPES